MSKEGASIPQPRGVDQGGEQRSPIDIEREKIRTAEGEFLNAVEGEIREAIRGLPESIDVLDRYDLVKRVLWRVARTAEAEKYKM